MTERFAIFYAPATNAPLWARAAQWLGRDAATGTSVASDIPGLDAERRQQITESARRYGFHATLKPPMVLAEGTSAAELTQAMTVFAAAHSPVAIGKLKVALIGGFLALVPEAQSAALTALAADCVVRFDHLRAPMAPAERDKRLAGGLSDRQIALLDRYGYPYVLDQFQFHMTLTERLPEADRDAVRTAAENWFAPVLEQPFTLDRLVLFHETRPGAAFLRHAEIALGPQP